MMKRREFITVRGGAAAWPLLARAQQPVMPGDGLLSGNRFDERELAAIRKGRVQDSGIFSVPLSFFRTEPGDRNQSAAQDLTKFGSAIFPAYIPSSERIRPV